SASQEPPSMQRASVGMLAVSEPDRRLDGGRDQRQAYLDYARAFGSADFESFGSYYTKDAICDLHGVVLRTREGIVAHYREMFETVRESLTLHRLIADDAGFTAEVTSQFTAVHDAPTFYVAPLRKGECIRVRTFVRYALHDGKISHVKVGPATQFSVLSSLEAARPDEPQRG
ncbi:MAG: nuclear transport factor 2 family protein, partial [Steroidobacteraceae bacterium]